jgi:hypothetical protein
MKMKIFNKKMYFEVELEGSKNSFEAGLDGFESKFFDFF